LTKKLDVRIRWVRDFRAMNNFFEAPFSWILCRLALKGNSLNQITKLEDHWLTTLTIIDFNWRHKIPVYVAVTSKYTKNFGTRFFLFSWQKIKKTAFVTHLVKSRRERSYIFHCERKSISFMSKNELKIDVTGFFSISH